MDQLANVVIHGFPLFPSLETSSTPAGSESPKKPRTSGQVLNPMFDEWLMALPIGWTDSESTLSETEWCRWLQRMRTSLCALGWQIDE